jgi:hypothetical protein
MRQRSTKTVREIKKGGKQNGKIKKELLELGFCINSKGIFYWIDLIKLAKENPNMEITKMYIELAKMNKTSYTSIERCLRTAMQPAKINIQKKYNYNSKISNLTFLNLMKYELI